MRGITRSFHSLRFRCGTAGHTFIEMVTALAFMGIVGATGAPLIPRILASYDLSNTAGRVVSDLRLARMRAVVRNASARVQFSSGTYVVQSESPRGSGLYVDDAAPEPIPATVSVNVAPSAPMFNSRGLVPVPATITLTGAGGVTKTISVSGIGRVSIN